MYYYLLTMFIFSLSAETENYLMAASVSRIAPAQYCASCNTWPDQTQDFQKIIDLKNVGLAIYRHIIKIPVDERNLPGKSVEITKEIFILHNKKDVKISASEFLPELEKNLMSGSCCLKTVERALTLLRNVQNVNKNEVRGLCNHCLSKKKYCYDCDNVIRKFVTSQPSEFMKKGTRQWLSEIKHILDDETDQDFSTERIRLSTEVPSTPKEFVKHSHSDGSYISKIPTIRDEKSEKSGQSQREFATPLFPEKPALSDYAKETLLKMGKEMALGAAEILRLYSDKEAKDIEHLLKKIASQTPKSVSDPTTVKFRHSTESIMLDDDVKKEQLIKERDLKEEQMLSDAERYKKQYSDMDHIDKGKRFEESDFRENKRYGEHSERRYSDEDEFDRTQRPYERAPRAQQSSGRYSDEKDYDRKRRIDEKAPRVKQYSDQYFNEEDVDRKRRIDEKVPRTQKYRDRYPVIEKIESKKHLEQPSLKAALNKETDSRTISRELLLQRSRFASKSGVLKKDFSFYFPKGAKTKPLKGPITSSVLFKETREKLEAKSQEEKEKKRQAKLEAEKRKLEKKMEREAKAKIYKESQDGLRAATGDEKYEDGKNIKYSSKEGVVDTKSNKTRGKKFDIDQASDKELLKQDKKLERSYKSGKVLKSDKGIIKRDAHIEKRGKLEKGETDRSVKDGQKPISSRYQEVAGKERNRQGSQGKKNEKGEFNKSDVPKRKRSDQDDKENKLTDKSELNLEKIKVVKSLDDVFLKLIQVKKERGVESQPEPHGKDVIKTRHHRHKHHKKSQICVTDEIESDEDILECEKIDEAITDIIIGPKICKRTSPRVEKEDKTYVKSAYTENKVGIRLPQKVVPAVDEVPKTSKKGVLRYALSDRYFIDKGWTVLPTEKIVRKMNIYRIRPSKPEFDWFKNNKNKPMMTYDTGEKVSDFDENGRGRWYYRNGRVALDYYDAEEKNAHQRFVIYSSGEPDDRGHARPYTVLAVFDYLGNGIVYDHTGKIRLKYNQTEGVLLDRNVGPESHWKWHTLNDPPVVQQVIVDTQMPYKDADILELGLETEEKPQRENNEEMLAIEFENFLREKSLKLRATFKPFQIRMKALKINKYFSLKMIDQATIYIIYRDGSTNLKLNIGMILDPKEIIDTNVADLGVVYHSLEKYPAQTDSLARIQKSVQHTQNYEKMRAEHDRRFRIPEQSASIDKLTAAASRPMRLPLRTVPSCTVICGARASTNSCNCSDQ